MPQISLRGHHVKNLRIALYSQDQKGPYYDIIDDPDSTIRIVSTSDSICERCEDKEACLDIGERYGRSADLYDRIMARASGTRVGQEYKSSELTALLKQQSRVKRGMVEFSAMAVSSMICAPYEFLDWAKPRRPEH